MGSFKQLCLSWIIILSVAAICVSCQELISTLREGNRTCPGEEVIFTCTVRASVLAWSSDEYIGQGRSLQLSTADMPGNVQTSTDMDGNIIATATVTSIAPDNGERILESTLRITAVEASTVTCSGTDVGTTSIRFSISAVPGAPQEISAAEVSYNNTCRILVEWDPPANSDASDIHQYIVYVPSRNIRKVLFSTFITLTVPNCDIDNIIRVQVAAVNRVGCVGTNSSEVQPTLLIIPDENGISFIGGETEGGSTLTSSIAAVLFILYFILVLGLIWLAIRGNSKKKEADDLRKWLQDTLVKHNLEELYNTLKLKLQYRNMQAAARDLRATLILWIKSPKFNENFKDIFISCLEKMQSESDEDIQRVIENIDTILTGVTGINEEVRTSVRYLRTKVGHDEYKKVLDDLIKRVKEVQPDSITSILLSLCEKLQNIRQVKDYYYKQSKYDIQDLGTGEDRVSVPIWIDGALDDGWKDSLDKAVQAINDAAPGLSLSIIKDKDKKQAIIHVLAVDNKEPYTEVEGNIFMRLSTENFVTEIRLGKWKDDTRKGVCIHELFHALGFHHEHQYAIADAYVYHLDSGKQITINKNELGFIYFDTVTTTLYPCEEKCRENSEGHVCKWVLEAYPAKVNTEFDELVMVGLNLVYPPCVDKTESNNVRYRPKLGRNKMYYCGREVTVGLIFPGEEYTHFCGPDRGPNCPACRTIKSPRVEEILKGGRWQGMSGRVYCGRPFEKPGKLFPTHDGMCGMNNGPACPDCNKILNKEHMQSALHPRASNM